MLKEQGLDLANIIACAKLLLRDSLHLPWKMPKTIYGSIDFAGAIMLGYKPYSPTYLAFPMQYKSTAICFQLWLELADELL